MDTTGGGPRGVTAERNVRAAPRQRVGRPRGRQVGDRRRGYMASGSRTRSNLGWTAHTKTSGQGRRFAFQQREPAGKNADAVDQGTGFGAIDIESDRRAVECTLCDAEVRRAIAQGEAADHEQQQEQGCADREWQRIDRAQPRVRHGTGREDHKCHGHALVGLAAGSFLVALPSILNASPRAGQSFRARIAQSVTYGAGVERENAGSASTTRCDRGYEDARLASG